MEQSASRDTAKETALDHGSADHRALMDRIYVAQRHIYDLTRRYYLLGRDTLIQRMEVEESDRVLEVGCGTARNLVKLAAKYPTAQLYGIDASKEMLKTARSNLARAGILHRARLDAALAEEFSPGEIFGLAEPFDAIFFSYSLSMIPEWRRAIERALSNLRMNGSIWVVDFSAQSDLPSWFGSLLSRWLSLFHVRHRPELLDHFRDLERAGVVTLSIDPLFKDYAYLARLTKVAP